MELCSVWLNFEQVYKYDDDPGEGILLSGGSTMGLMGT